MLAHISDLFILQDYEIGEFVILAISLTQKEIKTFLQYVIMNNMYDI
jgi:hypothetical protein